MNPEQASLRKPLLDVDLPMLAAQWLAEGYDSIALRELAGLPRRDVSAARSLLTRALAELGHPEPEGPAEPEEYSSRDAWNEIRRIRDAIDRTHAPYAAAQLAIGVLDDRPHIGDSGWGDVLSDLLRRWDVDRDERQAIDDRIRRTFAKLTERDVVGSGEQQ